jgi:hypothetical protein
MFVQPTFPCVVRLGEEGIRIQGSSEGLVPRELGAVVHCQGKDLVNVFSTRAFDNRSDSLEF